MAPHSYAVTKLPSRAVAAAMGAHRWSHPITKGLPRKIRIVHVMEPTVIKTDARHFRELVQRLTGKPPNGENGGGGDEGGGVSSSLSSAVESASADSSSRAASGSSSDRAVVAPASAVKAEVRDKEGDIASLEEKRFARAFGEVLWDTKHGETPTTATVMAPLKEEDNDEASPEDEGFGRAFGLGVVDDTYDSFFHGLDDFLLSNFTDGFSL